MTFIMPPANNMSRPAARYAPPAPWAPSADDFDLTSGFRLVRRKIFMIAALSVLLTAAACPIILGLKPVYHAESRLMIHAPLVKAMTLDGTEQSEPLDLSSEIQRLLSRSIAERVIRDLKLDDREEFNPALRKPSLIDSLQQTVRSLFDRGKPKQASQDPIDRTIPTYYRALSVGREGTSNVIRIGFDSHDPQLAATVPNRLIGIYLEERNNSVRNRLRSAEAWIEQRIDEQRSAVSSAREAVTQYGKLTGAVSDGPQDEQMKAVMELSERQAGIMQSRAEVKATISALDAAGKSPASLDGIIVPDTIGGIERDLRLQQYDLGRLLQTYGDNAEEVVALRAKILKTQSDLGFQLERFAQSQHARLLALDRQEASVQAALRLARQKLPGSALAQTELERLRHVADREQTALDKLEEQRRTLIAQATLPGAEVEILSPAAVPLQPQGHGKLFYLIGALLASVCIAVTAAFVREMMDESVRSHDQLESVAGITPAGLIPLLSRKEGRSVPLFFGHAGSSMFGEAIRTAVISLKQSNGGKLPDSIAVTSAHGGEGKSLIARSLAMELAALGQRPLLIDGDLRCGNLGSLFKHELKKGLNEFLAGQAGLSEVIHHHAKTGIDFIPRGDPSFDHRPHLGDMAEIVKFARAHGQVVIFDSAPVLASTDTVHMAALAERTIMVVQWAKTHRRAVEYALQRLRGASNAEILVVINKVVPRKHVLYQFTDVELFAKEQRKYHDITI
ncbi:MAG: GumC family protein [Rhizobiaceae bacterium]